MSTIVHHLICQALDAYNNAGHVDRALRDPDPAMCSIEHDNVILRNAHGTLARYRIEADGRRLVRIRTDEAIAPVDLTGKPADAEVFAFLDEITEGAPVEKSESKDADSDFQVPTQISDSELEHRYGFMPRALVTSAPSGLSHIMDTLDTVREGVDDVRDAILQRTDEVHQLKQRLAEVEAERDALNELIDRACAAASDADPIPALALPTAIEMWKTKALHLATQIEVKP